MKSRKIGLKYCGGCKPHYDRVKAVNFIKERLKGRVELVTFEDSTAEGTLVVVGCPTACVDLKPFEGRPLWVVSNPQEIDHFIETMQQRDDNQ